MTKFASGQGLSAYQAGMAAATDDTSRTRSTNGRMA